MKVVAEDLSDAVLVEELEMRSLCVVELGVKWLSIVAMIVGPGNGKNLDEEDNEQGGSSEEELVHHVG